LPDYLGAALPARLVRHFFWRKNALGFRKNLIWLTRSGRVVNLMVFKPLYF
jgi:hypothetical protein